MKKATYWQEGKNLDYKNSTSEIIEAGQVVSLVTRIGIAGTIIPIGAMGSIAVEGVFKIPKASVEISLGDLVYFDETNSVITKNNGDIPAGYAISSAKASDEVALVKLLG